MNVITCLCRRFRFIPIPYPRYLLIIFLLFVNYSLSAQDRQADIQKAAVPQWVKPYDYEKGSPLNDNDVDGGEYLVLFDEQYNLEKEAVYHKIVRQITSEAGVQNSSQISVTFSPSYQKLIFHTISVARGGQVIDQLDLSKIKLIRNETDLGRYIYSGLCTAYLNLDDIRPGDRIEYSYTLTGMNPVLDHHFGDMLYFNSQTPISHLLTRIITAPGQTLYIKYFNKATKPGRSLWNNKTVYEWKMEDRPAYLGEPNEPAWYYGAPYVQVTTDANWQGVADWAVKNLAKAQTGTNSSIQNLVSEWNKEAGDSTLLYVKLATRFVQDQVRYMGVEMGPYSFLPRSPDQVMKQRYGDCKDKSLLLYTFLHLHHIEASVAFVNTDYGNHLTDYLPSVGLFDHAIVTFNYEGNTYWIDPTINYQRGNMYNIATPDFGYALVISPGEDSLTRMQVNTPGYTQILERFFIPKEKGGKGILAVKTIYTGAGADNIRQQFKMNILKAIQKDYLNYYNQLYNNVSLLDSIQYHDDEENNVITVREKYAIGQFWRIIDSARGIRNFTIYAKSLQGQLPASGGDNRKTPLAIMSPVNLNYMIQLVLPDDWNIQSSDEIITRPSYYYSFASSKSGDTINLNYIYQTFSDYIKPDSVSILNSDLRKINADLTYNLSQNDSVIQSKNKVSSISLFITFLSLVFFIWLAIKMYRYSPDKFGNNNVGGRAIGGWLILICIGLCVTPFRLIYGMITLGYYNRSIWLGAQAYHQPGLMFLIAFELMANIFLIISSIFLLFLFFKRRNTLPVAFIFVYAFNIVFLLGDHFVSNIFIASSSSIPAGTVRLIIYSCIWIPYFLVSKRVKETFVYSYGQEKDINSSENTSPFPPIIEGHEDQKDIQSD